MKIPNAFGYRNTSAQSHRTALLPGNLNNADFKLLPLLLSVHLEGGLLSQVKCGGAQILVWLPPENTAWSQYLMQQLLHWKAASSRLIIKHNTLLRLVHSLKRHLSKLNIQLFVCAPSFCSMTCNAITDSRLSCTYELSALMITLMRLSAEV